MSVKPTTRKNSRRSIERDPDRSDDPKYLAKLVKDGHATDLEDAKHVAKLVAKGALQLGKSGPPNPDLLRPGPKARNVDKAIRWMMRGR